jgi:thiamine phosphate synthase YjbQ (UPF0047 family)
MLVHGSQLPLILTLLLKRNQMTETERDIHQRLRDLLDREHATYRVIEHEPEGHTEMIAKIRGNRIQQSIKSIVVRMRLNRGEP